MAYGAAYLVLLLAVEVVHGKGDLLLGWHGAEDVEDAAEVVARDRERLRDSGRSLLLAEEPAQGSEREEAVAPEAVQAAVRGGPVEPPFHVVEITQVRQGPDQIQ